MERGEIRLKNETVASLPSYLVSRGVPLPPGAATEPEQVSVVDDAGQHVPASGRILQRRLDGSIEWLHLDILVDLAGEQQRRLFIQAEAAPALTPPHPVTVTESDDAIVLSNGLTELVIPRHGGGLVRSWRMFDRELLHAHAEVDLQTVDAGGKIHRASLAPGRLVRVTQANPLRAVVRIEGGHQARDEATFLHYALQFTLTANCADVRIDHTFYCREPREGKVSVSAIRLLLPTTLDPNAPKTLIQAHHGHSYLQRVLDLRENLEVVASSQGDIDNYRRDWKPYGGRVHGMAGGHVFLRNVASLRENPGDYPWYMRPGNEPGFRAEMSVGGIRRVIPWIAWREEGFSFIGGFRNFAQLHPKAIAIDEGLINIAIWPEWSVPLELTAGVSKTHSLWFSAAPEKLTPVALQHRSLRWEVNGLDPVDISFDPEWPRNCQVLDCQHLLRYQPQTYPMLENLIESFPAAGNPHRFTYPRHDPSGMLNFGDIGGPGGFTNNEDDVRIFAPLQDYLRTGNTYCFDTAAQAAEHYMEVDWCEWSPDPRQRGGLIPHTVGHFLGNVYPSHQWSEGILAYYYLTGDERARRVVLAVGDNYCYWTQHNLALICCDGREAGMPLVNLAAAYRLSRRPAYLEAAHTVIANFQQKWFDLHGDLRYPYPQAAIEGGHEKTISGYGDWSSYYGLYRIWEVSGDEAIRELLVALLDRMVNRGEFGLNDARTMDFFAVWAYIHLTGRKEETLTRLAGVIPMLLRRGGHPTRRLQFLDLLDREGLIDERLVGTRKGEI